MLLMLKPYSKEGTTTKAIRADPPREKTEDALLIEVARRFLPGALVVSTSTALEPADCITRVVLPLGVQVGVGVEKPPTAVAEALGDAVGVGVGLSAELPVGESVAEREGEGEDPIDSVEVPLGVALGVGVSVQGAPDTEVTTTEPGTPFAPPVCPA